MYRVDIAKDEYYDFILSKDTYIYDREISDNKLFKIDVTEDLCSEIGYKLNEDILLENISLTGYDNFFIKPENSITDTIIDPDVEYLISSGDTFCISTVSGYTKNLVYDIEEKNGFNLLKGGFYQGFFKIQNYPVEFFQTRMRKGWTVNMLLKFPISSESDLNRENTLSGVYGNEGFVFYLGTRAENKLSNLTNIEVNKLKDWYSFEFLDTENLYTYGYYALNGAPYSGYYNIKQGLPYTGRKYDVQLSERLTVFKENSDIIDNAFGVFVKPDGRIGYRTIYATDPCYTGDTIPSENINKNDFTIQDDCCENIVIKKIITKYFTVEECETKNPIIEQYEDKYILLSCVFERYIEYGTDCELKYGDYKKGSLKLMINGFTAFENKNFTEVIPHALDTDSKYQEGVPFNISFGGGTQGLFEAIPLDESKPFYNTLEKFFGGSFFGGVKHIEMYNIPLSFIDINKIIDSELTDYNLFRVVGGRRVFLKSLM